MSTYPESFEALVRRRQSIRQFFDTPVPKEVIESVLSDAQRSPSNCNTQPWQVHIVSGEKRDELSTALLDAHDNSRPSPDFYFDMAEYPEPYVERNHAHAKARYDALGIARDDREGRAANLRRNLEFFDAPHVALLFMPQFGDGVRVAGDLGMYGQTFLLSLTARGLGGIPQTMLGLYADTVRDALKIESQFRMLYGISFGYPDRRHPINGYRVGRVPIGESVVFHE
ncbi:nitroreductase [Paraburkholderia flagellata]|uniref:nitroreductase n=1 Tax=Paraburkholderia flagellata TaxID=2883241 RepID=UPI001F1817DC|nr:nitroreductase [Paraburkholderia flagellata]